jgi:GNAT superfamily N-acetyltransferase
MNAEGARPLGSGYSVRLATEADLPALLPLVRAYTDFYESSPTDEGLEGMCLALIRDPEHEGPLQVGVDPDGRIVGFAGMRWKWSTLRGAKIGYLEDLFVEEGTRGSGLADALIAACADRAREIGAPSLMWQTMPDNLRAQAVYNRVGGRPETLIEYELDV